MTSQAEHLWGEIQSLGRQVGERDQEIARLQAERDALRAFAQAILRDFPEGAPDAFGVQDFAVQYGLLEGVEATEPCAEDGVCNCEGYGDFPQTCYRRTELLTGEEG